MILIPVDFHFNNIKFIYIIIGTATNLFLHPPEE